MSVVFAFLIVCAQPAPSIVALKDGSLLRWLRKKWAFAAVKTAARDWQEQ
jgi:hypothetical protein